MKLLTQFGNAILGQATTQRAAPPPLADLLYTDHESRAKVDYWDQKNARQRSREQAAQSRGDADVAKQFAVGNIRLADVFPHADNRHDTVMVVDEKGVHAKRDDTETFVRKLAKLFNRPAWA